MSYEQGMREPMPPYEAPPNGPRTAPSTSDLAREQSAQVAGVAIDEGSAVAGTAIEGTKQVAAEARQQVQEVTRQARAQVSDLLSQTQDEVRDQASAQARKAAANLRALEGQLTALSEGRPEDAGQAGEIARQLRDKVGDYADRLERGGYQQVLSDVQRFARRRPGVFLLSAAATGFAVGRLVRGAQAADNGSGRGGQIGLDQPGTEYTGTPGSSWGKEQPDSRFGQSPYPPAHTPYPPEPSPYPAGPAQNPPSSQPQYPTSTGYPPSSQPQYPTSTGYPPSSQPQYPTSTETAPRGPEQDPFVPDAHPGQP